MSRYFKFLLATLLIALATPLSNSMAMEFTIARELGLEVPGYVFPDIISIHGSGPIVEGDTERLAQAFQLATRDQFGNMRIYFHSPGGSVAEARKMVAEMDKYEVTAVVGKNDSCVSACASILFLSARIHLVTDNGELGFHTCRVGEGVPSSQCNDLLSGDLVYRGTDFGATTSFLKVGANSAEEVMYMDWRAAVLWGLQGPPTYDPTLAKPTFDCGRDFSDIARITCADLRLSRYQASYVRSRHALAKMKGQNQADADREIEQTFRAIAAKCRTSKDCYLIEYANVRRSARVELSELDAREVARQLPTQRDRETALMFLGKCREPEECGRVDLLDAPYEFAQANFSKLFGILLLADKRGESPERGFSDPDVGTSNCVFDNLCDDRIKTMNWVWMSDSVVRKVPREEVFNRIEKLRAALPPQELQ